MRGKLKDTVIEPSRTLSNVNKVSSVVCTLDSDNNYICKSYKSTCYVGQKFKNILDLKIRFNVTSHEKRLAD